MINDSFKLALNNLQNRICSEIKTDNVLLIFDNEQQKRKYKKYLKENNLCEIDRILLTLNDLFYENTLKGLRFKRYWFMTDDDMKNIKV